VPLDEHREWYRYHHLFAELLRHRLQMAGRGDVPELYRRASDWCAQNKYMEEAIDYALQAKQLSHAAQLVQTEILERLLVPSRWLRAFPPKVLDQFPAILTAQSGDALLSHLRDTTGMKTPLEKAEEAIGNSPQDTPQRNLIEAYLLITKAIAAVEQYEPVAAMSWIHQAQPLLPADALALHYFAQIVLSQAARNLGDNKQALQAAIAAEAIARQAGLKARAYIAVALQMSIHIYNGDLQHAINQGQQTLAEYPSDAPLATIPPSLGGIHVYLAKVLYEQNQLDQALEHLQKGLQLLRLTQQSSLETHGYILAADIQAARGDWEQAFRAIEQARQSRPIWKRTIGTAHIRLLLRNDDWVISEDELIYWFETEHSLLESVSPEELARPMQNAACFEVLVRVMLAFHLFGHKLDLLQDLLKAEQILEQRQSALKALGATQNLLSGYITLSLVKDRLDKPNQAIEAIKLALSLGAQHGYQRIFLDESKPMENLLRRVIQRGEASLYARQLLGAFQQPDHSRSNAQPVSVLIEPLNEREQDVLRLMAAGLSNPEIAEELYLSLNTIKTHTRGIYGKLGVGNRTQATVRARELGLI
jgi:LuxR family maltose regulon positive regulatory protein